MVGEIQAAKIKNPKAEVPYGRRILTTGKTFKTARKPGERSVFRLEIACHQIVYRLFDGFVFE